MPTGVFDWEFPLLAQALVVVTCVAAPGVAAVAGLGRRVLADLRRPAPRLLDERYHAGIGGGVSRTRTLRLSTGRVELAIDPAEAAGVQRRPCQTSWLS